MSLLEFSGFYLIWFLFNSVFFFNQPGSTEIPDTSSMPETPLDGIAASDQISNWTSCQFLCIDYTISVLFTS